MKTNNQIIAFVLSLFVLASCTKESDLLNNKISVVSDKTKTTDLVVPAGFNWETSRNVTIKASITDARFSNLAHQVEVYTSNPANGGTLLAKGSANPQNPFAAVVYVPNTVHSVFIVKTAPDNGVFTTTADITSANTVNLLIGSDNSVKRMGKTASPDCSSGCTSTISSNNSNINVNSGNVVCITGSNITIGINANGGTVRICGSNVTVSSANLNNGTNLIVTSGASATFSSLNLNSTTAVFNNWGTVNVSGSFSPGGTVTNYGTLNVSSDLSLNSQATLTNEGDITVGSNFNVNGNCLATNNHSIIVNNSLNVNGQGQLDNNCYLWIKQDLDVNNDLNNYSYIRVDDETTINGGGDFNMYSGAMLRTYNTTINGTVRGYVSNSLYKVNNTTRINGGGEVKDYIQYYDVNGIETNHGTFSGGAATGSNLYVATSSCNPEGNGSAPVTDTDGDGVPDNTDEYPNDATKAYNNYYPSATGKATVAFEDQWPTLGDYDMNDVVVSYRYNVITNASNNVVSVNASYTLRADGGTFDNGFAVQFPVNRNSVSSVSGATLESGQTKAVLKIVNNVHLVLNAWNTVVGAATADSVNYSVSFNVGGSVSLASFGLGAYNPFIWNGSSGYGRGYETHLPGQLPTDLATTSLFGTLSDNTNVGANRYYVSKNGGLPWAISIPERFDYPIEKSDITGTYTKFATWVQSNGNSYTDWYKNLSGYRVANKIY